MHMLWSSMCAIENSPEGGNNYVCFTTTNTEGVGCHIMSRYISVTQQPHLK